MPQPVGNESRLGLREPELPGAARVLDRGEWRGPGAAAVPRDQDVVGVRLRHAGGHRAHPGLGHQLHAHPRLGVHRLEIKDQLGQVFDGIDVVMRRR